MGSMGTGSREVPEKKGRAAESKLKSRPLSDAVAIEVLQAAVLRRGGGRRRKFKPEN